MRPSRYSRRSRPPRRPAATSAARAGFRGALATAGDPYFEVVHAKQVDANRCVTEHGNPPPGTRVVILVAPDGHPKSVTLDPESVGATPLGACIKDVFKAATFPRNDKAHKLEVKLVRPA